MSFFNLSGRRERLERAIPIGMEVAAVHILNVAKSSGPYTVRVEPISDTFQVSVRGKYHPTLSQYANKHGWTVLRDILLAAGRAVGGAAVSTDDFD